MRSHVLTVSIIGYSLFYAPNLKAVFGSSDPVIQCGRVLNTMHSNLSRDTKADISQYPSLWRLETVIHNSSARKVRKLFRLLTPQVLQKLQMGMEIQRVNLSQDVKTLVSDLQLLYRHRPDLFQKNDGSIRVEHVLEGIREARQKDGRRQNISTEPENLISALGETESRIFKSALEHDPKPGNALKRFFFPLYKRVMALAKFNDFIRENIANVLGIDKVIEAYVSRTDQGFKAQEGAEELVKYLEDTPAQISELLIMVSDVYGIAVAKGSPQDLNVRGVYRLHRRLKDAHIEEKQDTPWLQAVEALDAVDAYAEQSGNYRAMERSHLATRFSVRHWNVGATYQSYEVGTSREPGVSYTVTIRHSRAVYKTNEKGHSEYSHTEYWTETKTIIPSYEDILNDHYPSHGGTRSGHTRIRAEAAKLVAQEVPYRNAIARADELIYEVINNNAQIEGKTTSQVKQDLMTTRENLQKHLQSLEKYVEWSESQILRQYRHDSVDDFQARNYALLDRFVNSHRLLNVMIVSLENSGHLPEEVFKAPHKEKRDAVLTALRKRRNRAHGIKAGVVALGIGVASLFYTQGEVSVDALIHAVEPITSAVQQWIPQSSGSLPFDLPPVERTYPVPD